MIASGEWLSLTRASGLLAYGTAVICCGIAWLRATNSGTSKIAAVLTFVESFLVLDIAFNWRWMLHDFFAGIAERHHEYATRRLPQIIVVSFLCGLLLSSLAATWRWLRNRRGALLAVSGGLLSCILWCVEVVSLHAVDHVLYAMLGGTMAVSLLWVLACGMTSVGILVEAQKRI